MKKLIDVETEKKLYGKRAAAAAVAKNHSVIGFNQPNKRERFSAFGCQRRPKRTFQFSGRRVSNIKHRA